MYVRLELFNHSTIKTKKKGIYYYKSRSKGTKVNLNAKKLNKLFAEKLGEYELKESLGGVFEQTLNHLYDAHISQRMNSNLR